ncbi:MAG: glycosyltransferase family 2 protein [Fimbriimonas sp.]
MAHPLVSIVCPSYNHAPFLREGLAGVQAQTFPDWELILVDDGSRDESVNIAREIAADDPRIRVHVNAQNLGTYGTEERARAMAKGRYVAVLNSDDLWEPEKLAEQVALLEANPTCGFCYTLGWKIDEHGEVDRGEDVHHDWPTEPVQELLPHLLYENRVLASSVLFRAEAARFDPSLRYSGDWVALLGPAREGPVACVPKRLNYWRMHSNNTFVRSPKQVHEEVRVRIAIMLAAPRWLVPRLPPAAIRRGLGRNALNLAALEILRGNRSAAMGYALTALRLLPERRIAARRLVAVMLPSARTRLWPGDATRFEEAPPHAPPLDLR